MDDYDSNDSQADDFPQPSAKRRRTSNDETDDSLRLPTYTAPSRIQKATQVKSTPAVEVTPVDTVKSDIPTTSTDFAALDIAPWLVHSLRSMQIHNPTEIQRSCIPEILKGRDCIGGSRTGTGKTVAFAVPILQKWAEDPFGIYAVILTPTRELALQIYEQFNALGASQSLKTVLITGGSEMRPQAAALARRPHIVVATPGRLADHIQTSGADTTAGLSRAKVVVLDEADRLLASEAGMLPDINTCLSALPPATSRLTLLFTATVTAEVRALKSQPRPAGRPPLFISEVTSSDDPTAASASSFTKSLIPATLRQTYLQVPLTHKDAFLHVLLSVPGMQTHGAVIIFANRTATADVLHRTLLSLSSSESATSPHRVTSLHSGLPQVQRNRHLADFRSGRARVLIATDVASRGLDIPAVDCVVNYDVPRDPVDYVHRVGRTARAGRSGMSVTFVGQRDVRLVLAIEEYTGSKMEEWKEDGVNVETRVLRGRVLKDVGEARMEALREVEGGKDVNGWRRKMRKDRKRDVDAR